MLHIVVTDNAKFTLQTIFDFIEYRFGVTVADDFLEKVEHTLHLTASNPEIFKPSPLSNEVRMGFITKQTSFFYQVTNSTLVVLYFWDNRQEPLADLK